VLAIVAAVLFAIGFIINAASVTTSAIFSWPSFLLAGLACLALHMAGIGTGWGGSRLRRR
jgi:hypothetical protein